MANNSTKLTSLNSAGRRDVFDGKITIALTILGIIICILDLLGNTIVIHVVRTRAHMRSTTNLLIANLAVADLLMVVVVVFLTKHYFVGFAWFPAVFGHVTCKMVKSLQPLSVMASVLSLTAITFDRFFAIIFPLKTFITTSIAKRLIAVIWVLSVAFSIPITVVSMSVRYGNLNVCFENWRAYGLTSSSYVISFFVICYLLPLVVMATLYTSMGIKLWRGSVPGVQTAEAMDRIKTGRRKATKMLISVVTAFALCWFPLQLAELLRLFAQQIHSSMPFKLNLLLPYFGIANSVVNPFIYILFCEKFRFEFSRIFCPCRRVRVDRNLSSRSSHLTMLNVKSSCGEVMVRRSITAT